MIRQEDKTELLLHFATMAVVILLAWIVKSLGLWPQFMGKDAVILVLVIMLNQAWLRAGFAKTPYSDMPRKQQQKIIIRV